MVKSYHTTVIYLLCATWYLSRHNAAFQEKISSNTDKSGAVSSLEYGLGAPDDVIVSGTMVTVSGTKLMSLVFCSGE